MINIKNINKKIGGFFSALLVFSLISATTYAVPTYVSPNYGVDEIQFGAGGTNDMNSANYNSRASLGDLAIGNSASAAYQAYAGFTTSDEPFLEIDVPNVNTDLGVLTPGVAATTTATFEVRAWLANGYTIVNGSNGPAYFNRFFNALNTPTAWNSSQEQFGINLVANTNPANVGANPVQLPDASFSFGQASAGYNTDGLYKYVKGEAIANSPKSSSITEYTITYLFNATNVTSAGTYTMNHQLVAVGNF